MTLWLRSATGAVRAWTQLYTWRLEPSVRDARRAEIQSDLWEQLNAERAGPTLPLRIVSRLVLGITDDMRWRIEHVSRHRRSVRRLIVSSIGSAIGLAWLWVGLTFGQAEPPTPPAAPAFSWRRVQVPPPPPPPPPPPRCNPPGIGRPPLSPCTPL
jgi:hypothetical protein